MYSQYRCLLGPYVYPFIATPLFIFQWRFDAAQLGHDNVSPNSSPQALRYAQQSAANLTQSFAQNAVRWVFSPSCYQHTIVGSLEYLKMSIGGQGLIAALEQFVGDPRVPIHLIDSCNATVNCNPLCGASSS